VAEVRPTTETSLVEVEMVEVDWCGSSPIHEV